MTQEIVTQIDIAAPASRVWQILTDFAAYSAWNPFVRLLQGELREGVRLEVLLQIAGQKPQRFTPTLIKLVPQQKLRWLGKLWGIPGLFTGEHRFQIEPLDESSVRFVQAEQFHGILAGIVLKRIGAGTREGFQAMNEALKHRVEAIEG